VLGKKGGALPSSHWQCTRCGGCSDKVDLVDLPTDWNAVSIDDEITHKTRVRSKLFHRLFHLGLKKLGAISLPSQIVGQHGQKQDTDRYTRVQSLYREFERLLLRVSLRSSAVM
jgi:hypothetical protein